MLGSKEADRFFALKTPIFIPMHRDWSDNAITGIHNWLGVLMVLMARLLYILLTTFDRFGLIRVRI